MFQTFVILKKNLGYHGEKHRKLFKLYYYKLKNSASRHEI